MACFESWDWYLPGGQLTAEVCCLLRHDVSSLVFLVVGLPCCRGVFLVVIGLPDCRDVFLVVIGLPDCRDDKDS